MLSHVTPFSISDIFFPRLSLFAFELSALILHRLPFGNPTLRREAFIYFLGIFWIKVTIWPVKQAAEEATPRRLLRARSLLESIHALRKGLICVHARAPACRLEAQQVTQVLLTAAVLLN